MRTNVPQWEASLADYLKSLPPERRVLLDRYKLTDAAMKVVGVGSVGTFCGIALLMSGKGDPLFSAIQTSAAVGVGAVCGSQSVQACGTTRCGRSALDAVRQRYVSGLVHRAGSRGASVLCAPVGRCQDQAGDRNHEAANLLNYARLCGWALARAHARSGDAAVLTGYLGTARPLKMPSSISARPMPIRTSAIMRRWWPRCDRVR